MGVGKYKLTLTILPPSENEHVHFGRHIDKETGVGSWFKPFTVDFDFVFAGTGRKAHIDLTPTNATRFAARMRHHTLACLCAVIVAGTAAVIAPVCAEDMPAFVIEFKDGAISPLRLEVPAHRPFKVESAMRVTRPPSSKAPNCIWRKSWRRKVRHSWLSADLIPASISSLMIFILTPRRQCWWQSKEKWLKVEVGIDRCNLHRRVRWRGGRREPARLPDLRLCAPTKQRTISETGCFDIRVSCRPCSGASSASISCSWPFPCFYRFRIARRTFGQI